MEEREPQIYLTKKETHSFLCLLWQVQSTKTDRRENSFYRSPTPRPLVPVNFAWNASSRQKGEAHMGQKGDGRKGIGSREALPIGTGTAAKCSELLSHPRSPAARTWSFGTSLPSPWTATDAQQQVTSLLLKHCEQREETRRDRTSRWCLHYFIYSTFHKTQSQDMTTETGWSGDKETTLDAKMH